MMTIPADARDDLHARFGHALSEYDGLAEAIYDQDMKKAAPIKERPLLMFGFRMSLPTGRVVDHVRVGVVLQPPANRS